VEASEAHATQGVYGSPTPQHGTAPAASPQTRHSTRARRWVWDLGRAGVVALGYFLSAKVGLAFVVQPEGLAAVWPPSGFLLAVLVLSPQRAWAVILGGVLCSNTVANLTAGLSLTISLGFSLANCAESMTAAWLLVRFLGTPLTMTTLRDVMGLTGLAVIASNAGTACLGAAVVSLGLGTPFWAVWRVWWIAVSLGMLVLAPTIVMWVTADRRLYKTGTVGRIVEAVCLYASLVVMSQVIFGVRPEMEHGPCPLSLLSWPYMAYAFLFWAALRFGPHGTSIACLALATVAVWSTAHTLGPFAGAGQSAAEQVLAVQIFLSVVVFSALTAAAVVAERQRSAQALQESEARFRTMAEAIPIPVSISRLSDGRILYANASYSATVNVPPEALVGRQTTDFYYDSADRQKVLEALHNAGSVRNYEIHIKKADGTPGWVLSSFRAITFNGEPAVLSGFYDLTERKRMEEDLRRTAVELARSNADLEQFAYAASHDLQEPVRAVVMCLQLFQASYTGRIEARADELIRHAVEGGEHMRTLIDTLLAYARVSTRGTPLTPTDCTIVLTQVLANLKVMLEESGAMVTHDPLPTVLADATQLLQVFQNLLGNAIKFRTTVRPTVHISAERQEDAWRFAVRDNGIGIEPQYAERIFVLFQRLHTRRQHPGTGIGLALCKKIDERHGGRIWVESALGQGATFFFTLPHVRVDSGPRVAEGNNT